MAHKDIKKMPDVGDKISFSNRIYNSYYADNASINDKAKRPLFYRDLKKARREAEQLKIENDLLSKHSINSSDFKPVVMKRSKAEESDLRKIKKILARELGKATTIKDISSQGKDKSDEGSKIEVLKGPRDQFTKNMPENARKEIARLIYREFKKARQEIAMLKMENKMLRSKSISSEHLKSQQRKRTPLAMGLDTRIPSPIPKKKSVKQKQAKKPEVLKVTTPTPQPVKRRVKRVPKKDSSSLTSPHDGHSVPRGKKPLDMHKMEKLKTAEADLHSKFNVLMEIAKMGGGAGKDDLPKKLTEFKKEFMKKM